MSLKFTAAFVMIFALLYSAECKRYLKLTNMECKNLDPDYINIDKCFMKAIRRDVTQVTVNVKIYILPVTNMTIRFKVKKRGNALRPIIFDSVLDVCDILENKQNTLSIIGNVAFKVLRFAKYSNVNHSCPINHDILFNKWELDETQLFTMPFALGDYGFLTTWMTGGAAKAQIDFFFKYYEK